MDLEQLAARYQIPASGLYARLTYLKIDPASRISRAEIEKLDALHQHLAAGQNLTSFHYVPSSPVTVVESSAPPALAPALRGAYPQAPSLEYVERIYEFLQKAADAGWHLPASVIRNLIGAKPRGKVWRRYGFEFRPASRHGTEIAWSVCSATSRNDRMGGVS